MDHGSVANSLTFSIPIPVRIVQTQGPCSWCVFNMVGMDQRRNGMGLLESWRSLVCSALTVFWVQILATDRSWADPAREGVTDPSFLSCSHWQWQYDFHWSLVLNQVGSYCFSHPKLGPKKFVSLPFYHFSVIEASFSIRCLVDITCSSRYSIRQTMMFILLYV
jgi:hypothetical protein